MRGIYTRSKRGRAPGGRGRPIIEAMESRLFLTAVVVNSVVDQTDPPGSKTVSLRDAIATAAGSSTPTAISFDTKVFASHQTITLDGNWLQTHGAQAINIFGPAAGLTISGNALSRVFVTSAGGTVSMSNLTITGGSAGNGQPGVGGGIYNQGNLTLTDCTISGNHAGGDGGGIESSWFGTSKLTLINVTISGNSSGSGDGDGGGGIRADGTVVLQNVTISNNFATDGGGGLSFGSVVNGNSLLIGNTIVAGNTAQGTGPDVNGNIDSLGHNLIGITNGSAGWISSDYTGTAAKPLKAGLGALANNAGPTQTLLPLAGSPAIDKGSNALIPSGITADQRGLPRIVNGTVDIGAVEVQPAVTIKITPPANQSAAQGVKSNVLLGSFTQSGGSAPFKADINWGDGTADTILTLTAAGAIPTTAHVFARSGTITVSESVTDARGHASNRANFAEMVAAARGIISGEVFNDANGDGKIDGGEVGLGLWTVYLDVNNDGKLDSGDIRVTTDIHGGFSFTGLVAGTYTVRILPLSGISTTTPSGGVFKITLATGQASTGHLFGEKAP